MSPDSWVQVGLLISALTLTVNFLSFWYSAPRRVARKRVRIVERERELRIGNWIVWKVRDRETTRS